MTLYVVELRLALLPSGRWSEWKPIDRSCRKRRRDALAVAREWRRTSWSKFKYRVVAYERVSP
jgi:hypothetical protein